MSDYPWHIRDQIDAAIRGKADNYEVTALREYVGRLEHSLREVSAALDGVRAELQTAQDQIATLLESQSHD